VSTSLPQGHAFNPPFLFLLSAITRFSIRNWIILNFSSFPLLLLLLKCFLKRFKCYLKRIFLVWVFWVETTKHIKKTKVANIYVRLALISKRYKQKAKKWQPSVERFAGNHFFRRVANAVRKKLS
jgi:hypothetical protein